MNLKEFSRILEDLSGSEDLIKLKDIIRNTKNIIVLGNGGSSAIASHTAQDYTKALNKKAFTFSDSSRLTCYTNDYGWEFAYKEFLEDFANKDTLTILISSSGNSKNILNCAEYCILNDIPMITLSGFKEDNLLRTMYSEKSKLHFYVKSSDYGVVEYMHGLILHSVI